MIVIRTNLDALPNTCTSCRYAQYDESIVWKEDIGTHWGGFVCAITRQLIDNTKRDVFCPLEEVQEQTEDGE